MAEKRQDERRRASRVQSLNLVNCEDVGEQGVVRGALIGRTLDMSPLGAKLEMTASTPGEFPNGSELAMTLALHDELLMVWGRVVHCEEKNPRLRRVGVEFTQSGRSAQRKLAGFLALTDA